MNYNKEVFNINVCVKSAAEGDRLAENYPQAKQTADNQIQKLHASIYSNNKPKHPLLPCA